MSQQLIDAFNHLTQDERVEWAIKSLQDEKPVPNYIQVIAFEDDDMAICCKISPEATVVDAVALSLQGVSEVAKNIGAWEKWKATQMN